ncbi:monodechloroaminopyrrolnitrin synthase PrnB family protein [Rhodococcus aerolatus]
MAGPDEVGSPSVTVAELVGRACAGEPAAGDDALTDVLLGSTCGRVDDGLLLDHEAVRAGDPLGLDDRLAALPAVNEARDATVLTAWLGDAARHPAQDDDPVVAVAALRDTGMVLAALRRLGTEPLEAVPALEPRLLAWAAASRMVPRDTVVHYTLWNPTDHRARRQTRDPQEVVLVESVRRSCRLLPLAAVALDRAVHDGPTTAAGLGWLRTARVALDGFAAAFGTVTTGVSPAFFARELRPFFDPVTVAGTVHLGPAAAFVPLFLVTGLLHGTGEAQAGVHDDAVTHGRPRWRTTGTVLEDHEPLTETLLRHRRADPGDPGLDASCALVAAGSRAVLQFQGQHLTVARRTYRAELTSYTHGSGGYPVEVLARITDDTRTAAHALDRARP